MNTCDRNHTCNAFCCLPSWVQRGLVQRGYWAADVHMVDRLTTGEWLVATADGKVYQTDKAYEAVIPVTIDLPFGRR